MYVLKNIPFYLFVWVFFVPQLVFLCFANSRAGFRNKWTPVNALHWASCYLSHIVTACVASRGATWKLNNNMI